MFIACHPWSGVVQQENLQTMPAFIPEHEPEEAKRIFHRARAAQCRDEEQLENGRVCGFGF